MNCPMCLCNVKGCGNGKCSFKLYTELACPWETCPYRKSICHCPSPFKHMSVTEIREYRDVNRDCSQLEQPSDRETEESSNKCWGRNLEPELGEKKETNKSQLDVNKFEEGATKTKEERQGTQKEVDNR